MLNFSRELAAPQQSLWKELSLKLKMELDQIPIVLPVPNDPKLADVPIVQAVSKNGVFRLNISRKRLDFFIHGEGSKATYQDIKNKFYGIQEAIIVEANKIVEIEWLGLILNFFIAEENANQVIAQLINSRFRKLHQGETLESSVDYISQLEALGKTINNHTQLQFGRAKFKSAGREVQGILISRDFNTKPVKNGVGYVNGEFTKEFTKFVERNLNLDEMTSLLWYGKSKYI